MKIWILFFIAFSFSSHSAEWMLDKSHSSIAFAIDHLVISETTGTFSDYTLVVRSAKEDFTDATFNVEIKTDSIDTKDAKRDEHLRGVDFFNVAKNPTITFTGKKFEKLKNGKYKIHGTLKMNGVQREVAFDGKFGGIVKDPWGGTRAGLKVLGSVDRYDYGLKYNSVLESGGLAIGREVRILANVELIKQ